LILVKYGSGRGGLPAGKDKVTVGRRTYLDGTSKLVVWRGCFALAGKKIKDTSYFLPQEVKRWTNYFGFVPNKGSEVHKFKEAGQTIPNGHFDN